MTSNTTKSEINKAKTTSKYRYVLVLMNLYVDFSIFFYLYSALTISSANPVLFNTYKFILPSKDIFLLVLYRIREASLINVLSESKYDYYCFQPVFEYRTHASIHLFYRWEFLQK